MRRRVWQVALPAAFVLSLGIMVAVLAPRRYQSKSQLELRESSLPVVGQGTDVDVIQRDVAGADKQMRAYERVKRVVESLEWSDYETLDDPEKRRYLSRVVLNTIVQPVKAGEKEGSSFIFTRYTDTDPHRAADFLNALNKAYIEEKVESVRKGARAARETLEVHLRLAETRYKEAAQAVAKHKRDNGLSATQQAPGGGRMREEDPAYERLAEIQKQVSSLEIKREEAKAIQAASEAMYSQAAREIPVDTKVAGVDVSDQVAAIEALIRDFRDEQTRYRAVHRRYKQIEKEIQKLEEQLIAIQLRQVPEQTVTEALANPDRPQLLKRVDEAKATIASLEAGLKQALATREELQQVVKKQGEIYRLDKFLEGEAERALALFDEASKDYERQVRFTELLEQPEFNPFQITEVALPPVRPTSPNLFLVLGFSLIAALVTGVSSALFAEFYRGAYRSVAEVVRATDLPVLGAINVIRTRDQARLQILRRFLTAASAALVIGSILWVTWAYSQRKHLLAPRLVETIDNVRKEFR